jgi:tryptophan synthase alpha subunit
VTWAIVIDMPDDCVQHLEEILEAKSLNYIHVIPFNCDEDEEDDEE